MVGQERIQSKLNSYTLSSFPQTSLIVGQFGCGKHTLVNEIAKKFNVDIIDMTNNISLESINQTYTRALPTIYLIDASKLNERQQNIILKFLEEPIKGSYIILLSEGKESLLETILNRCVLFEFEPYTKEQLSCFIKNDIENKDLILMSCNTPGQIMSLNNKTLKDVDELCNNIINKIHLATFQNTLSISTKFNYKDEYDKIDLNVFFTLLSIKLRDAFVKTNESKYVTMYQVLNTYLRMLKDTRLNKEHLIENMLTKLWLVTRQ